jgi:glycine cleavage system H protein
MDYPQDFKYTEEHEWAKIEGDTATIGITWHAQDQLGDIVYLELPEVGKELNQMGEFGVVESVKSVSSLYSPLTGTILEVNQDAVKNPEIINGDPQGKAWLIKLKLNKPDEANSLLSAEDYRKFVEK